tara:strand:+ start:720 stop:1100 length:381 start_codon:yes stop_codon:yes gene_type:complete
MFYRAIILLLSISISAQEYEINSDKVEINTELNTITYIDNVNFNSDSVKFNADILSIDQTNEAFQASGTPIKIEFFDGQGYIKGEANTIEIVADSLILKDQVTIIRSGNKINSDKIVIRLGKNDQS